MKNTVVTFRESKGQEKLVVDGAFHLNNERNRKEMEGS